MNTQECLQTQQCSTSCTLIFIKRCLTTSNTPSCYDPNSPSFSDFSYLNSSQVVIQNSAKSQDDVSTATRKAFKKLNFSNGEAARTLTEPKLHSPNTQHCNTYENHRLYLPTIALLVYAQPYWSEYYCEFSHLKLLKLFQLKVASYHEVTKCQIKCLKRQICARRCFNTQNLAPRPILNL